MKSSLLPGAGYGLVVEREFKVRDTVSIYLGYVNTKVYRETVYKKYDERQYKLEAKLPSKEIIVLDIDGGGFPGNKLMHLGAHMMINPPLDIEKDKKYINAFNVGIAHNMELVAEKVIHIGDEIYDNYQYL